MLNEINLIMYAAKFETFLFDNFFFKIDHILIYQISLMKNIQSTF